MLEHSDTIRGKEQNDLIAEKERWGERGRERQRQSKRETEDYMMPTSCLLEAKALIEKKK